MGDLRVFNLKEIKKQNNCDVFIETGTFMGDGVQYAIESEFNSIHSIEIDNELFNNVNLKFKNNHNVVIHNGHSINVLNDLLEKINQNVFFWLDAHFPGADAHKVSYDNEKDINVRAPLEGEIEIIQKRIKKNKDTLIIDDLWLYEDGPFEWGSFDEHSKRHNFNITRKELMKDRKVDSIYDIFNNTHNIEKNYKHQGYLIITPK
jgi:hypothetical protein